MVDYFDCFSVSFGKSKLFYAINNVYSLGGFLPGTEPLSTQHCDNCGQYFLLPAGKYSNYCECSLADNPDKTCHDIGARKRYGDKCKIDPIWRAYKRAYKALYARYMKKKMTTAQIEQWSRYAVELLEQAQAEYERLL